MNKLYILGALALANVEAATALYKTGITIATQKAGGFTYTVSTTDCYSAATATTLGMNNIYYQYYTFDVAAGTAAYATATPTTTGEFAHTYAYNACMHTHLYNWMAQPVIGTSALTAGLGSSLVAYGYVLSGTAVTACTNTIATGATTSLYSSTANTFSGAAYQSLSVTMSPNGATAITIAQNTRVKAGTTGLDNNIVKAGIILTYSSGITDGLVVNAASNLYWDFMQTEVIQGQTQFGRGGGASTSPCGWFVIYAYEVPGPDMELTGNTAAVLSAGTTDAIGAYSKATVHMWTDNAVVAAASSVVLAAGALLF